MEYSIIKKHVPEKLIEYPDQELKQQVICGLCMGLIRLPILVCSSCNYYGCSECIQNTQVYQPNKCPSKCTQNPVTFSNKHMPMLHTVLGKIQIKCPNSLNEQQNQQCQEKVSFAQYQNHIDNCKFNLKKCDYPECEQYVQQDQYEFHRAHCEFKQFECEYCFNKFKKVEYQQHDCEYKLIKCTNEQCDQQIQKIILQKHINEDCEYTKIACIFCQQNSFIKKNIKNHENHECEKRLIDCKGCKRPVQFKEYQEHENQCEFIKEKCKNCDTEIARINFKNHDQNQCIQNLRFRLEFQQKQHEETKDELRTVKEQLDELQQNMDIMCNFGQIRRNLSDSLKRQQENNLEFSQQLSDNQKADMYAYALYEELGGNIEEHKAFCQDHPGKNMQELLDILLRQNDAGFRNQ